MSLAEFAEILEKFNINCTVSDTVQFISISLDTTTKATIFGVLLERFKIGHAIMRPGGANLFLKELKNDL